MTDDYCKNLKEKSPAIAWIHNISLNQQKYMKKKLSEHNVDHEMRYVLFIYEHPNSSQQDLVNMFGLSKGNIAKTLKKLEDQNYIKREINPDNRREYIINTTEKGNEFAPKFRELSREWEKKVGINEEDAEFKEKLISIAENAVKLI